MLATPGEGFPHTRSVYDAFGRVRVAYAEDGSLTSTSYHALSTDVCDPLDNDPTSMHFGTCTTARTDGHGRLIDQLLRNREPGTPGTETHRLWTYYRNDGAVVALVRAQADGSQLRLPIDITQLADPDLVEGALGALGPQHVFRTFFYDTIGRRIGSDDPDTNNPSSTVADSARSWRYLFNRAGDLSAVRDPRGCGQNFFYDLGGRLLGEQYVGCPGAGAEYQPGEEVELDSRNQLDDAVSMTAGGSDPYVDVQYFYDAEPWWTSTLTIPTSRLLGRATGVRDRAQRAAVAYDDRGNAVWTARQVAVISAAPAIPISVTGALPTFAEPAVGTPSVVYDEAPDHTYIRTAHFDHAGRPRSMALPQDPDWDGAPPLVEGTLEYDRRGLPQSADLIIDSAHTAVVSAIHYLRDGLVDSIAYGDHEDAPVVTSTTHYDERRRPTHLRSARVPTATSGMQAIDAIADQRLVWDAASNLTAVLDQRDPAQWPIGHRPQSVEIQHDSLYRVVGALFNYTTPGEDLPRVPFESLGSDDSRDWRDDATTSNAVDPMRPEPAPAVTPPDGPGGAAHRVQALAWDWDWLGNMTEWTDDAQQFYERSIGEITNGHDVDERPSALYFASDLTGPGQNGGYVELDYGVGGNVTELTAHGECVSSSPFTMPSVASDRRDYVAAHTTCTVVQHYQYRWDELNRIHEARRFDLVGGEWSLEARQRYRYDGANVRVVKESFATDISSNGDSRVALYVYPGDFERRGVVRDEVGHRYGGDARSTSGELIQTETQYLVVGARVVWQHQNDDAIWAAHEDRDHRVTFGVGDLLHTTNASVDLRSGELLEVSAYYPNGARESLLTEGSYGEGEVGSNGALAPLEPSGFTGKEPDEDVGLVYFGERYLIARLGRWASPDPLHVHAGGGGQALNAFHYVGGNLLQGRDQLGFQDGERAFSAGCAAVGIDPEHAPAPLTEREQMLQAAASLGYIARMADEAASTANLYLADARRAHEQSPGFPMIETNYRQLARSTIREFAEDTGMDDLIVGGPGSEQAGGEDGDYVSVAAARMQEIVGDDPELHDAYMAGREGARTMIRIQTGVTAFSFALEAGIGGQPALFARGAGRMTAAEAMRALATGALRLSVPAVDGVQAWRRMLPSEVAGTNICARVADVVRRAIRGRPLHITPTGGARSLGQLYETAADGTRTTVASGWGEHWAVLRQGRVYDQLTGPAGMTMSEYRALWENASHLNFTTTSASELGAAAAAAAP